MAASTGTPRHSFNTFRQPHGGPNDRPESSDTNVGIPFHGSCSRCHHFHINHPFTFSLDSTVHSRLFCERCNHPMFGLGRVSTQNTLASVESGFTFTPRACIDRTGQQQPPALQVETVPGTSTLGLLTTIEERRSPPPSRSTSNMRTPARMSPATSLAGQEAGGSIRQGEIVESRALPEDTAQGSPDDQTLRSENATLGRLRSIGRRFKRRFSAKTQDWRLPRVRLQISYAASLDMTDNPSARASATAVSSGQEQLENVVRLVSGTGDETEDRHASLRAQRRELTLARERELTLFPKCECGPECPCIGGSQDVQVGRADTPDIPVPSYAIDTRQSSTGSSNSQPSENSSQALDPFLHIGRHFDSPRRSSSADESSSAADSGSRRVRLSQGSTLWSYESSTSLRARRPNFGRASSMPIGTRAQYLAGVRTGLHITSLSPSSSWPETAREPALLDDRSIPRRASHTESSRSHEDSSHESSISLANLPDSQADELVNGVSPRSHTPMRDVDEVTPTPRSGIRIDGSSDGVLPVGSEELSSALQDLANGAMTDHDFRSPESHTNGSSD